MNRILMVVIGVLVVAAAVGVPVGLTLARKSPPATYVALGDSLAAGVGAIPDEQRGDLGYVGRFNQWFVGSREGPHRLANVGVAKAGGETSSTLISDGQLARAKAAIDDPKTDVQVVTLDVGGNDLDNLRDPAGPCAGGGTPACLQSVATTLGTFKSNYETILGTVKSALDQDPGVERVFILTYYNPFDGTGHALEGLTDIVLLGADKNVDCAAAGNALNSGLNDIITCIGLGAGVTVVDVYPLFVDKSPALTHVAEGKLDIHPNNDGHKALADALIAAAR
jgi:lysophospholipase L1-like esterase